uniref:helix-turn-helix transcriptional regulator n=1 Tax=Campylobacter fetus TaxID=196 RepID=UPI003AF58C07
MNKFILDNSDISRINKSIQIDQNKANISTKIVEISKDIGLHINNFIIYEDNAANYDSDFKGVTINITFSADHYYKSTVCDFYLAPKAGRTLINYFYMDKGVIHYKVNTQIKNVIITIKNEFLEKYLDKNITTKIQNTDSSKIIQNRATYAKTAFCASEIYKFINQKQINALFIKAKILEILSYELTNLNLNLKESLNLSKFDILSLNKAMEILKNDYKNPPSITELSKKVRLNQCKLKQGFKTLFRTTPYSVHMDTKMQKAKEFIEKGELSLNQISKELGYKQPHNFTTAFKKYFGLNPSNFTKTVS